MTSDVSTGRSITVVDYDPAWPIQFETLRSTILSAVGDIAVAVEHVGSTSVPGLAAKPIIDIDVVVASAADVSVAIERLAVIGYEHRGNLGVEGREAFGSPPGSPRRNLYVCIQGGTALQNHLALREYLRSNSDSAARYARLKKQLAARFPNEMDAYVDGKTDFVLDVLREMGLSDEQLAAIDAVNRLERYPYRMTTAAPPFQLRPGRPEDALPILEAQLSAIRETAASAYSPAIIDEWAPVVIVRERVEAFQRWIERGEESIVVAMDPAGQIIGFGSIVAANSELRAVYVAAAYGRQGVGRALLARLEELARDAGLAELRMDASINAVPFYEANGFISLERGEHPMPSGRRMACVRMRKLLRS